MKHASLSDLFKQLSEIEKAMLSETKKRSAAIRQVHPLQQNAAKNLIHYLTLRNKDIRNLQDQLHICGLSSLASAESHIHRQLQAILQRMGKEYKKEELDHCTYDYSKKEMDTKSKQLFGDKKESGIPYIMITFDSSFADNYALIKNLLQNGMNVARINCAHDNEAIWSRMIQHLKRACKQTGLSCKIYMDLAGPKIRTRLLGKGKTEKKVKIKEGEIVWLAESIKKTDEKETVISPNESGIICMLKKGDRVYIDDGMIKGFIEKPGEEKAAMRVVRISSSKQLIKEGKGINFPDTFINISPLTDPDKANLPFICEHADMIGFSFVRYTEDINALFSIIDKNPSKHPHLIIKIETTEAVKNLPSLLLTTMQKSLFGVMIARGDLAVEIGFERMGEIQEEILWICEAAHVPVIWATQVLENLNKSGLATRSEITDATHAAMAECVMINKGDHTIEVIEALRDILHRTGGHHLKKRYTFRPLSIAQNYMKTLVR
ncbi:MAG: pyruvate kinase [Chitinophagaceae bacterium]